MKIVTNKSNGKIEIAYEGWTYTLKSDDSRKVDEKTADFLHERYPFVQVTELTTKKGVSSIPQIEREKTRVYVKPGVREEAENEAMKITPAVVRDATLEPDSLPTSGTTDKDGVEWVGEGIEDDDLTTRGVFR